MNGRNSSHASGQRCSRLGCVDELLFSLLQMVSAMCMSMYVSAIVWEVSPSQLFWWKSSHLTHRNASAASHPCPQVLESARNNIFPSNKVTGGKSSWTLAVPAAGLCSRAHGLTSHCAVLLDSRAVTSAKVSNKVFQTPVLVVQCSVEVNLLTQPAWITKGTWGGHW